MTALLSYQVNMKYQTADLDCAECFFPGKDGCSRCSVPNLLITKGRYHLFKTCWKNFRKMFVQSLKNITIL
jgi:hypothetical protein